MSDIERIDLAFQRGKAARLAGLPLFGPWVPVPREHWLYGWHLDGWHATGRGDAYSREKENTLTRPWSGASFY